MTCDPDLVKVAVALDTGGIVEYNATGYIMNHTDRGELTPKITQEEAQKSVSPRLKVESGSLALIPTPGLNEVLCYECQCTGENEDRVLVYICRLYTSSWTASSAKWLCPVNPSVR